VNSPRERNRFWVSATPVGPEGPQVWKTALVSIFDGDAQVGSYARNHAGWAHETFEPFQWNNNWFALYSPDYTTTRVMSLPDCKDIGGEMPAPDGFCPVEFYAPRYREATTRAIKTGQIFQSWRFDNSSQGADEHADYISTFGPWTHISTAFVAGCIWGDDASRKLECIDLASAAQGRIVRSARFGHVQLARKMALVDSLEFDHHPPHWELRATLIRQERRDIATGALIDPYDE